MSAILYRDWKVFVDQSAPRAPNISGHFIVSFANFLMADQTIAFIAETCELSSTSISVVNRPREAYGLPAERTVDNLPMLRLFGNLDTSKVAQAIAEVIALVDRLSYCVDFPLVVVRIEFLANGQDPLVHATRRPIARAVAFEVEERGDARAKLSTDFGVLGSSSTIDVASKFYMTGMKLLGLEDQVDGLIDAAFMQFYQGCEVIIGHGKIEENKKRIASFQLNDNLRDVQIAWHQIYHVRNMFFGHGNPKTSIHGQTDADVAHRAARQALVVRWILRRLIDLECPSNINLAREMRFYSAITSYGFGGDPTELNGAFWAPQIHGRSVNVYDSIGTVTESYRISDVPHP